MTVTDRVIVSLVMLVTMVLLFFFTSCKTLNTAIEYGVGQIEEYEKQKKQCEENGRNWLGKIENQASWECKISIIEIPVTPEPIDKPKSVDEPEPVIVEESIVVEEPIIVEEPECKNTSTNYCGGSVGHTFKASGRMVTFTVTGIEDILSTRFIYWMEDLHGNWYNSILYGYIIKPNGINENRTRHRGMYNGGLIEHGEHSFDPSKEYIFIVAWGGGLIIQEIFDGQKRLCSIRHEAFLENIRWAKIGRDAHGETAFKILSARIE